MRLLEPERDEGGSASDGRANAEQVSEALED